MKKYVLLIGDGNGAASRGLEGETLFTIHTEGNNLDDAINNAQDEIREIDRFDYYDDLLEDEPELSYADYFNDKDPSGGDIWLLAYLEDGKLNDCYNLDTLKTGEDGEYEFNTPEDAELFGLPAHIEDKRYPEDDEEDFDDYDPDDVEEDDTEDYEDNILHTHDDFQPDDTEETQPQLTTDDMNGGQWYESLNENEDEWEDVTDKYFNE